MHEGERPTHHTSATDKLPEGTEGAGGSTMRRSVLPNGMEIAYQSKAEVAFFYNDIFEKQIYLMHGVTLREGDCVFDVGANVGFFTLFANRHSKEIKIYAFEPAPPLFEILRFNTSLHGVNAKLFNCGVSSKAGTATFTFYPNSSGMSSFYADKQEEKEALRAIMLNQRGRGVEGMERIMQHAEDLLEERVKSRSYECRLRTISDIISEEHVEQIDFMKIDVQKSELDVLAGIHPDDWPKIKQIVIEVHDVQGRLRQIHELLAAAGYRVAVEQDAHYESSSTYNLFAIRNDWLDSRRTETANATSASRNSLKQIQDRARKQEEAFNRQKQLSDQRKRST
jgi:FkbM family methyltransferase